MRNQSHIRVAALLLALLLALPPVLFPGTARCEQDAPSDVIIAGRTYSTAVERLDLTALPITDIAALEAAFLQMPNLKYVDMSRCRVSNADMAALRQRQAERGVEVVWLLSFGTWTLRTDATAFSTRNSSNSKRYGEATFDCIRYATKLQALDLGHNWMFSADFIAPLNDLRVLILSDNRITDISFLAGKPLEYFEMFNNRVRDISCLTGCETLIDLNLCATHISDLTPLHDLPNLRRVWMGDVDELTRDEINQFLAKQGDRLEVSNFFTIYPTYYGWREHPRYDIICEIFATGAYIPFPAEQ